MPLTLDMIQTCAPDVSPVTIQRIVQVESQGNPLAINVNGVQLRRQPRDAADAAALAREYIAEGYTVDLGLMQVNSANLPRLGYSVEDMFDPCKNLAAGAAVLTGFYLLAKPRFGDEQAALRAALSAYNTGSFTLGFANGYVARYYGAAAREPVRLVRTAPNGVVSPPDPYTAPTVVFVRKEKKLMANSSEQTQPVVSRDEADLDVPGVQVEQTADEAERNGAFFESAMTEADAWESNADLADPHRTAIVVGGQKVMPKE